MKRLAIALVLLALAGCTPDRGRADAGWIKVGDASLWYIDQSGVRCFTRFSNDLSCVVLRP